MNAPSSETPALSLFNADALVLVAAVALIFVLAGITARLSLRAKTRVTAIAGLLGVLVLMAFLPFWVSLLSSFLVIGQNNLATSSSYMWLSLAAVIRLDRVFAVGVLVSGIAYFVIPGTHGAKLLRTMACLGVVVVVAVVYTTIQLRGYALIG